MPAPLSILIFGAGHVGSYLGAHLASRPDLCTVHLVGRPTHFDALRSAGFISAHSQAGPPVSVPVEKLQLWTSVEEYARQGEVPDVVVVTVKRLAADAAYEELKEAFGSRPGAPATTLVTFMNGVRAAEEARQFFLPSSAIPVGDKEETIQSERAESSPTKQSNSSGTSVVSDVVEGMWPFNVIEPTPGTFIKGSAGDVVLELSSKSTQLANIMTQCGIQTRTDDDMRGLTYGKLIMNLHNAISALTGLPIRQELSTRSTRKVWARCISECLAIYAAHGISPTSFVPLPYYSLPYFLALPNIVFLPLATKLLSIDSRATSSMYEDLRRGRKTEIAYLQGEVVRLGKEVGIAAPVCERVEGLVRDLEGQGRGVGRLTGEEILDALELI
ncbi:ketopantoate reductase PanE/ApbA C terminal-domain-containing protein [Phlyctochytrium arcticum]|nr:ketopantoate reductase PanE/ApbA C terminal-domain-containing protein [Phlyctochytrium arcticum]